MPKKYYVYVREVHVSILEVEANSKEEAKEKVCEDEGTEIALEYSHTLDPDTWTVEEAKEL